MLQPALTDANTLTMAGDATQAALRLWRRLVISVAYRRPNAHTAILPASDILTLTPNVANGLGSVGWTGASGTTIRTITFQQHRAARRRTDRTVEAMIGLAVIRPSPGCQQSGLFSRIGQ
ncbi:MAG: hypothetical protein U5K76_13700 [Woeseiaceae bacterium]|nr:hypothetical protein [Woeseiaceae bacterium]